MKYSLIQTFFEFLKIQQEIHYTELLLVVRCEPGDELVVQFLQCPPPQVICPLYSQGTSVVAVMCQGVMVTYRCVDGLCLVVTAIANNGTSGSTRQDVIEAALATMVSSLLYMAQ